MKVAELLRTKGTRILTARMDESVETAEVVYADRLHAAPQ